jgi:REP element-mobilizing transposase RayT
MARGNGGDAVFVTDDDRKVFLHRLGQVCESHGWKVHAWVLMGNHFHLLLETPEPNLVSGMKWLLSAYSQGWNRAHMRRGHVFQGRYKAVPVNASDSAGDGASWFSKPIRLGRQSGQYDAEIDQKYRKNVNPCTLTPLTIDYLCPSEFICG